jgi:nickel-dependent lactate racemase
MTSAILLAKAQGTDDFRYSKKMQIHFAFGRQGLDVTFPNGPKYEVIESRSASSLPDVDLALGRALDQPIGCEALSVLASGKKTAAISVCDITRPAPNWLTLPPLLRRLHDAGIPVDGVTILIATGLHREATPGEINAILGPEIASKYRVVNHDARAFSEHRALGKTQRGIPVYIDEQFMAADLHITLGFIEQHLMLGFSGGRKIARMARHDFMLDVTLTQTREVSGIFAGDPVKAHAAGVQFLRTHTLEKLSGLADAVITSAAGHPLDLTFYQTVKGLTAAQHLVKPGGRILTLGECSEGVGSPEFAAKVAGFSSYDSFLDEIEKAPVVVDQWQLEKLALAGQKHELFFYVPGIPKERLGSLASRSYASPEAAVAAALDGLPAGARVALVPEGPYVFARADEEVAELVV